MEGSPYLPSIIYKGDDILDKEVWKDIVGYEGLYQVSNYGRIKSLERIIEREKMGYITTVCSIMKTTKYKGYESVFLSKNGVSTRYRVHRLVAEAFIPKYDFKLMPNEDRNLIDLSKLEVNHKDESKSNNNINNLEWCTHLYNMKYGTWKNRRENNFDHSYCYKKVNQYDLEGNFIKTWDSISLAKKELGINHISDCCNGKRNKAGDYIWRYA